MVQATRKSKYIDRGFGFPITLSDVPMVRVDGEWTPEINYNQLAKKVLLALAERNGRLTGNQVRFIRMQLEMTLQQFAKRLRLTHPAVLKWESAKNLPTGMSWTTEKDIRLFTFKSLKNAANGFLRLYSYLEEVASNKAVKVSIEADTIAA